MIEKTKRHLHRYKEIGRVFSRHSWGWALERVGLAEHAGAEGTTGRAEDGAIHIREMLEELGPTFIKLGQLLSTRPDIVPEVYVKELSKLQDTAPTLPYEEVRAVVEEEFHAPLSAVFAHFEKSPLAAASLAQAHRARLHDGTPVIVKVQRPNIRELVETDIEILYRRAKFMEAHWERARIYGVTDIVDEFAITIREELDYTREARNTEQLREALSGERGVMLPAVFWELTTAKVLTLEMLQGTKITELPSRPDAAVDQKEVAARLARAFLEQVFVDGFFHADPHPGNLLVDAEGKIALLDCGQVSRLDAESKAAAVRMLIAFEQQDSQRLADELIGLNLSAVEVDAKLLIQDLNKVLRAFYDTPSSSVNIGQLLMRVLNISANHKIRIPVVFTVLGKVFSNIEGICRQLDSDFNFTQQARAYAIKAVKSELSSENTMADIYQAVASMKNFLLGLPENLERLMRKAVEGNLRVEFKHQNLGPLSESFRTGANRVSIALIVGATIVGSSLVVVAGRGPMGIFGLPALGLAGYLVALVFGAWLVVSVLRSNQKR